MGAFHRIAGVGVTRLFGAAPGCSSLSRINYVHFGSARQTIKRVLTSLPSVNTKDELKTTLMGRGISGREIESVIEGFGSPFRSELDWDLFARDIVLGDLLENYLGCWAITAIAGLVLMEVLFWHSMKVLLALYYSLTLAFSVASQSLPGTTPTVPGAVEPPLTK